MPFARDGDELMIGVCRRPGCGPSPLQTVGNGRQTPDSSVYKLKADVTMAALVVTSDHPRLPRRSKHVQLLRTMSSSKPPISTVIVEDNPALLELLTGMLDGIDGIRIVGSAASEADAIALIQATRPQLAIVDLELREGTGLKVLSAIQSTPRDSGSTRAVVFSNHSHPVVRSRCLALGAEAFFDKSFQMDELLEFVHGVSGASA